MKKYMVIIAILIFILMVLVGRGLKYKQKAPGHIEPSPKAEIVIPQVREKPGLFSTKPFTIQVGSYKEKARAESEVAKLKGKGYSAYLVTVDLPPKGTYHRVRVEEFASKEEASSVLKKLKAQQGLKDAFITFR